VPGEREDEEQRDHRMGPSGQASLPAIYSPTARR
jgi:hypothetical protein